MFQHLTASILIFVLCASPIPHLYSTVSTSAMLGGGAPIVSQYSRLCPAWFNLKVSDYCCVLSQMLTPRDLNSLSESE